MILKIEEYSMSATDCKYGLRYCNVIDIYSKHLGIILIIVNILNRFSADIRAKYLQQTGAYKYPESI